MGGTMSNREPTWGFPRPGTPLIYACFVGGPADGSVIETGGPPPADWTVPALGEQPKLPPHHLPDPAIKTGPWALWVYERRNSEPDASGRVFYDVKGLRPREERADAAGVTEADRDP